MRPLTPDELRLLLERGVEALDDWKPAEIVASLALEVSEWRAQEAEAMATLRELTEAAAAITKREGRAKDFPVILRRYDEALRSADELIFLADSTRAARAEGRG